MTILANIPGNLCYLFLSIILLVLLPASQAYPETTTYRSQKQSTNVDQTYNELGLTFAKALQSKDIQTLSRLFNQQEFARIAAHTVFDKKRDIDQFMRGVLKHNKETFLNKIFRIVFNSNADIKYMRLLKSTQPLIRIDYHDGGHEYMVLKTRKNQNDVEVVDMFFLTSGKNLSASVGSATQLLLRPSKSLLKKLFNKKDVDKNTLQAFRKLSALRMKGNYQEAYNLLEAMPDEIRNERILIDFSIQMAQGLNEKEYRKQLSRLDKYYGDDESTTFILIDHHYYNNNYKKVVTSVTKLARIYGEDGALLNLISNASYADKDYKSAIQYGIKAIEMEPDFEAAYWTLVTAQTTNEDYANVVKTLDKLEQQFGYSFQAENFKGNDIYAQFMHSPEFIKRFGK